MKITQRGRAIAALILSTSLIAPMSANARGNIDKGAPGEEVRSICFTSSIDGFRTLEGEDDVVLIERAVNNWYYVELMGGCSYNRLKFAQAVGIDTSPGSGCLSRGDQLIFSDSVFAPQQELDLTRCRVSAIYEWVVPDEDDGDADENEDDQGDDD
jgi:hypothetical protein